MLLGRLASVLAFVVGLFFVGAPAESQGRFDGSWRLLISGTPGACEFGYWTSIRVRNGLVSWRGRPLSRNMIGISDGGSVAIRLSDGRHVVTGNGAIGVKIGKGRWAAPAFRCTGQWSAFRL